MSLECGLGIPQPRLRVGPLVWPLVTDVTLFSINPLWTWQRHITRTALTRGHDKIVIDAGVITFLSCLTECHVPHVTFL